MGVIDSFENVVEGDELSRVTTSLSVLGMTGESRSRIQESYFWKLCCFAYQTSNRKLFFLLLICFLTLKQDKGYWLAEHFSYLGIYVLSASFVSYPATYKFTSHGQ